MKPRAVCSTINFQRMVSTNNIWAQMGYVPPRGACNHKESLLSAKCSCLRFMIHPLKATTSFECDGCNHHASFHSMENPQEAEVIKRWQAAAEQERRGENTETGARKRPRRAIENGTSTGTLSFDEVLAESSRTTRRPTSKKKITNTQSRSRQTEVIGVDEEVEEDAGSGSVLGFFTRR